MGLKRKKILQVQTIMVSLLKTSVYNKDILNKLNVSAQIKQTKIPDYIQNDQRASMKLLTNILKRYFDICKPDNEPLNIRNMVVVAIIKPYIIILREKWENWLQVKDYDGIKKVRAGE